MKYQCTKENGKLSYTIIALIIIMLLCFDLYLINMYKERVNDIAEKINSNIECEIIGYIFYAIVAGTYSMDLSLKVLEELARDSRVAREIIKEINLYILHGARINKINNQKSKMIINRIEPIRDALEGRIVLESSEFISEFTSRKCEETIDIINMITSRLEENISIMIFALFFIPLGFSQIILITGKIDLVMLEVLLQVLLTIVLIRHVSKLSHKIEAL